jgi:hypothetical protein
LDDDDDGEARPHAPRQDVQHQLHYKGHRFHGGWFSVSGKNITDEDEILLPSWVI